MSIDDERRHDRQQETEESKQDQAEQGAESYGGDADLKAGTTQEDTERVSEQEPAEG